ncbi:MAG TPA: iron ABC transporter permease [Anaerolineae bacterium]|nr:iron ABC transporter permease [Anaerolineae bacterium]
MRRFGVSQVILGIAILVLVVFVVYPLSTIIHQSFKFEGHLSPVNYWQIVQKAANFRALRHSLEVATLSMLFATVIGAFLAWLVARTNLPLRGFLRAAFVLPFIIPPFIGAIAWLQLLGPVGYLNKFYMALTGSTEPLWNIYGPDGIILVMALHSYPLVYLTVLGGLERMNPELEEAAQISGSPIFAVMKDITLPLMAPTIAAGAVLAFIAAIANFGIPAVLGFSARYFVLTTKIYDAVDLGWIGNNLSIAACLSIVVSLLAGAGLLLSRLYLKGKEYTTLSGKSMYPNIVQLGIHKYWLLPLALLVVLITTVAPVVAIVITSLTKAYGLPPTPDNLTLDNFKHVLFLLPAGRRAIRNSLFLAVGAATIVSLLGSLIAYIVVKTKMRFRFVIDFFATMPYSIPGTVVALAMILAWIRPLPFTNIVLYNTIWIILIAYVARYLAFGVRTTAGSLAQIHDSLEEAATISGANWLQAFKDIVIPLIRPGLFASWFLVFMPCLRELTISILLWSVGHETIGVLVYNLQDAGDNTGSAALAVVMMTVLMAANFLTRRLTGGKFGY